MSRTESYMSEFLGKNFPNKSKTEMTKVQAAIPATLQPLTAVWRDLLDAGMKDDPDLAVPATEVLSLIQHMISLVGNVSELTS